jgi:hypothetical protein
MTQVYWKCPVSATQCKDFEKSSEVPIREQDKGLPAQGRHMGQGKAVIHLWFGVSGSCWVSRQTKSNVWTARFINLDCTLQHVSTAFVER